MSGSQIKLSRGGNSFPVDCRVDRIGGLHELCTHCCECVGGSNLLNKWVDLSQLGNCIGCGCMISFLASLFKSTVSHVIVCEFILPLCCFIPDGKVKKRL